MAKGDLPKFRIQAVAKDKDLPTEERYLDLAAFWEGNFEDSFNGSVKEGVFFKVGGKSGTVLTFGPDGDYYLELKAVKPKGETTAKKKPAKGGKKAKPAPEPEESEEDESDDDDDDVDFGE